MNLTVGSMNGPLLITLPDGMSFVGNGRWLRMSQSMDTKLGLFIGRTKTLYFLPDASMRDRPSSVIKPFAIYKTACKDVKIDLSHNGFTYVVKVSRRGFGALRLFSVGIEYVADSYGAPYEEK